MIKKRIFSKSILSLVFILFTFQSLVFAEELNLTPERQAILCLENSREIMAKLLLNNFSVARVNDTIREAEDSFEIQQLLKEKGRPQDYKPILLSCDSLADMKVLAFDLRDQIKVLEDFYKSFFANTNQEIINTTEINNLFLEIDKEMKNERYELVSEIIEKTYSEITLVKSRATTFNVFYMATTRGLKRFFSENWEGLLVSLLTLIIIFFLLKKPIEKKILLKKLANLEIRKNSLKEMITKNQDLYFNKGKISEDSFRIKNKTLAELVRDVDRQKSLLNEQLFVLNRKDKLYKNR